jgi:hypothetical protein
VTSSSAAKQQARAHEAELAHAERMAAVGAVATEAAPVSTGLTPEKVEQLKQLAELKAAGILSEAEFEVQKAKLLA